MMIVFGWDGNVVRIPIAMHCCPAHGGGRIGDAARELGHMKTQGRGFGHAKGCVAGFSAALLVAIAMLCCAAWRSLISA